MINPRKAVNLLTAKKLTYINFLDGKAAKTLYNADGIIVLSSDQDELWNDLMRAK